VGIAVGTSVDVMVAAVVAVGARRDVLVAMAVRVVAAVALAVGTRMSCAVGRAVAALVGVAGGVGNGVAVLVIASVAGTVMPSVPPGEKSKTSRASVSPRLTSVSASVRPAVAVIVGGSSSPVAFIVILAVEIAVVPTVVVGVLASVGVVTVVASGTVVTGTVVFTSVGALEAIGALVLAVVGAAVGASEAIGLQPANISAAAIAHSAIDRRGISSSSHIRDLYQISHTTVPVSGDLQGRLHHPTKCTLSKQILILRGYHSNVVHSLRQLGT
jgi:hypothetical protein